MTAKIEREPRTGAADTGGAGLRRAILIVAIVNAVYFAVEVAVALAIGSVSLLSDSVDFLEDGALNFLILAAFGWAPRSRARLGMVLSATLIGPVLVALWTAAHKFIDTSVPAAAPLSATGFGALLVNAGCAKLLARHREACGSLTAAAFLSERNDAIADIVIIAAGLVTAWAWHSMWPDLAAGIGIAIMNAGAARTVWRAARKESEKA